jgi:putative N6-adenine-specific DNA methylase
VNRKRDVRHPTSDIRPPQYDAFAVAAPGLEAIVAAELAELKVKDARVMDGGVEFTASQKTLYEANLHLRTASRVLVRLARFRAVSFAELERNARKVHWERILNRGDTVALRVTCRKSRLYHSGAVAERIERDLAERMGAVVAKAPPSDEGTADETGAGQLAAQLIIVRLDHDRCTISADSSGAHLHQRGYRTAVTQAPMRETLAAALVLASGWDHRTPLVDPFCGSGTIPIEAALIAARIAPGRNRGFRYMKWPGYDASEWRRVLASAVRGERPDGVPAMVGTDRSAAAIRAATDNAGRAGVTGMVRFEKQDAMAITAGDSPGWVVTNPPYGVRLGDASESRRLMAQFGDTLRRRFYGWRVAVMAPPQLDRALGIPLNAELRTTNGGLRIAFLVGVIPNGQGPAGV